MAYQLHPEAQEMVEYLEKAGKDRYKGNDVNEFRKNHSLSLELLKDKKEFSGKMADITIPSPEVKG